MLIHHVMTRCGIKSGADLGCSSNYTIVSRATSQWLWIGVEQVSLPTAVAHGSVGCKPGHTIGHTEQ